MCIISIRYLDSKCYNNLLKISLFANGIVDIDDFSMNNDFDVMRMNNEYKVCLDTHIHFLCALDKLMNNNIYCDLSLCFAFVFFVFWIIDTNTANYYMYGCRYKS